LMKRDITIFLALNQALKLNLFKNEKYAFSISFSFTHHLLFL
jgi:hypothetical protein